MKALTLAAAAAVAVTFSATPALADVIVPVSATASSSFTHGGYNPTKLINSSGLSQGGLHDSNYDNMWMTELGQPKGFLTFDLGGLYSLDTADLWQYNFGTNMPVISTLDRGVNAFRVLTSLDGNAFSEVFAGNMTRSENGSPVAAQSFDLGGVDARFVRLDLLSNFTVGTIYESGEPIGLSEVRFGGQAIAAVPEPSTWAMLILGFGVVGAGLRRRTSGAVRLRALAA